MLPTRHKVTLQHIISRSAGIEEAELEQFIHRQNEDDRFNDVIDDINRALHDLDFQLKRVLDQIDGRVFWYLQNMSSDTVSQQATFYPSIEVEFFRYLIEWIIQAENYAFSLSSLDIHRLAAKEEKLPLATHTVESYLQDFERDEWLVQRDGMYSLSNRSLADLEQYLRTEYENSVFECNACRGIVTLHVRSELTITRAVYAIAVTACMFTAAIDYSPSNVPAVTNLGTMLLSLAKAAMKMAAVFPRSVKICSIPVSRISYSSAQCCIDDIQQNDRETYKPHCPRVRQNEPLNMPKRLFRFLRSVPATSQRWVPLRPMTGRPFASSAPGSPTPSSSAAPQSLTQRIKALTKQYGWWGLGVYIGISLLDLSLSYLVVHSLGAEKIGAVQDRVISYIRENCPWGSNSTPVHVPEAGMEESKPQMTTFWTEFILAYGIHKALIVARVPLTIAIVPPLARRFRGSI